MVDVVRTKSHLFQASHRASASTEASTAAQIASAMPRPTKRAGQAASDAASAAEFAAKKYVWIPDAHAGYLAAWVVKEETNGESSICALQDGA